MKKIFRREVVVFKDSQVNEMITFPEVGLVNVVDDMVVYQSPKEKVDDVQVLVYRDKNQDNEINISIKEGHYDVASSLAKEARFYPKKELNVYISEAYSWVGEGEIENQLAIISSRIKKRKPEKYTILNEVSVDLNEKERIYTYPNYPEFDLNIPVNWAYKDAPFDKRSWRYGLNAWVFMDSLLKNESQDKLIYAKELALNWIKFNILDDNPNEFSWYDMGVAFRATRLPFIIDRCIRHDLLTPEEFALLSYALTLHVLDLTSLDKFASHSNHGLYQLCGLFAISKILPETKNSHLLSAYAEQQMLEMLERDVSEEGMHKEHSPDYHVYISDIVFAAINAGWVTNSRIVEIANKMNTINAFLLHPTTHAVRFGDTSERDFRSLLNKSIPELFYVYRNGKEGVKPSRNSLVLPESGYCFFREHWERKGWEQSSFLAFSAAFHKRTHKHADDFTFEWSEFGQRIIVDAGKYGYEKEAIERQYVESTRAHNCVEIDEQDYSRFNHDIFNSALSAWSETSEIKVIESLVQRKRFFNTEHRRTILFKPKHWLLVIDHLNSKESHKFTQWFHFHHELNLTNSLNKTYVDIGDKRLWVESFNSAEKVEHIKAQFEPRLQGWTSVEPYKLTPNDALGFTVEDKKEHTFATLFSFGNESGRPVIEMFKSSSNGKYLRAKWMSPNGEVEDIIYRISAGNRELTINGEIIDVEVRNA